MTGSSNQLAASNEDITALLEQLSSNIDGDVTAIDALLACHSEDARLHFMKGSVLAGSGSAQAAHRSLSRAVELAPDFAIARFQLGFFELTSGEPATALQTWEPLGALPNGHYLRHFVDGLCALIDDRFADCMAALKSGIAANEENRPLNNDMQLIVTQCGQAIGMVPEDLDQETDMDSISATALLLNRFGTPASKH